jgi:hypothetical protein
MYIYHHDPRDVIKTPIVRISLARHAVLFTVHNCCLNSTGAEVHVRMHRPYISWVCAYDCEHACMPAVFVGGPAQQQHSGHYTFMYACVCAGAYLCMHTCMYSRMASGEVRMNADI